MKDECGDDIITEIIALKSKCYSYLKNSEKVDKRLKGVKKCVIKNNITH
jgi:hypothetical protein